MTSWPAVRSESEVLGSASNRSKRKLCSGNRAGFPLPNQHFGQGLDPTLWIHESNLQGSQIKERCAAFGSHCVQRVGAHSCRDIKTVLDIQMDHQGLHPGKIHHCTNTVLHQEHSILLHGFPATLPFLLVFGFGVFFFVFSSERIKVSKSVGFWKPPSIHWVINSTCGAFAEYMKILTICYSHFQAIKLFKWFVLISFLSLPNSVISCLIQI